MSHETSTSSNNDTASIKVRCLVQQCLKARLQTRLPDPENNISSENVEVFTLRVEIVDF
jgi:hypothetical protein